MAYSGELYEKTKEIIEARKQKAESDAAERRSAFALAEPEYEKYKKEMIDSVKEAIQAISLNPDEAAVLLEKQKIRNLQAQQEIKRLLSAHSLPENFLDVRYFCPECEDTGVKNNKLCSCYINQIKQLAFEAAGKNSPLRVSTFNDFRLDYYDDKTIIPECKETSRSRMKNIFNFCKAYAEDFDENSENILFCGETGLGKTHLSLAIAGEAIKKGYNVIYNSAQNIFNELEKEHFGRGNSNGQFEAMVLECDLLVIDDLGAEFSTQFTNAALYNIINTRINLSLPTIISTNLNFEELAEKYTRRVSSRLIGDYIQLKFFGSDVRQVKKIFNK